MPRLHPPGKALLSDRCKTRHGMNHFPEPPLVVVLKIYMLKKRCSITKCHNQMSQIHTTCFAGESLSGRLSWLNKTRRFGITFPAGIVHQVHCLTNRTVQVVFIIILLTGLWRLVRFLFDHGRPTFTAGLSRLCNFDLDFWRVLKTFIYRQVGLF